MGYMHHQRCEIDRRSVRVRLTDKGRHIQTTVSNLFERHAEGLQDGQIMDHGKLEDIIVSLRRIERFWGDQIRYIY
ncbi:MAG: MarR family transcriptional regulator, partial [Pseudomonadota bacterium]